MLRIRFHEFVLTNPSSYTDEPCVYLFNIEDAPELGFSEDEAKEISRLDVGEVWYSEMYPECKVQRLRF